MIRANLSLQGHHSVGLMWWMLAREVLRMRGTISREHPWEVMPDLYFYRDPEEVRCSASGERYINFRLLFVRIYLFCSTLNRLRRKSRLQLRRLLGRRSSRVSGPLLPQSSPSRRLLTGLRVLLYPLCPSSSSLQVCGLCIA